MKSKRITRDEKRLILELLDKEIYDLAARLEPDKEYYEGQAAEDRLKIAVSARDWAARGLPENIRPLSSVMRGLSPRVSSKKLREALNNEN